jgi:ribosomal protein S18 acetylase RimI-like enzyme
MERLTEAHVPGVGRLLAEALGNDPGYAFLFRDPAARRVGLEDLFARNLRTHLPHRCTYVLCDDAGDHAPLATVTVRPPSGVPISLWTMVRRGLVPFAARNGVQAIRRLLHLKAVYDRIEEDLAEGAPHFHVHMMAVSRARQGQGLGSQVLADALQRSGALHDGAPPTVLTTNDVRNEVFYRRAGFRTVQVRRVELGSDHPSYDVWCMRRDGSPS